MFILAARIFLSRLGAPGAVFTHFPRPKQVQSLFGGGAGTGVEVYPQKGVAAMIDSGRVLNSDVRFLRRRARSFLRSTARRGVRPTFLYGGKV